MVLKYRHLVSPAYSTASMKRKHKGKAEEQIYRRFFLLLLRDPIIPLTLA